MNQDDKEIQDLLDWTSKQGRILTANGKAETYYPPERGYDFQENELPHYYLLSEKHDTHNVFASWATHSKQERKGQKYPVCGVWTRPLFVGGFEYSSNQYEEAFNIQTNTLFIDIRIPRLGKKKITELEEEGDAQDDTTKSSSQSKSEKTKQFSNDQLRLYARRHAFGGYTVLGQHENRHVCTRHHCIDWNFVGKGRNRPNKWFVEMHPDHTNTWKEFAFAKDDFGQHYYFEQWERIANDANGDGLVLALRKRINKQNVDAPSDVDGIIVIVGDHFNYIFSRVLDGEEKTYNEGNLVGLVDSALASGDRKTAEAYLSIDAGHGKISSGWMIENALQYWKEGTCLFSNEKDRFEVSGSDMSSCSLSWNGSCWDIYESSVQTVDDLRLLLSWRKTQDNRDSNKLEDIIFNKQSKKRKLDKVSTD